MFLLFIHNITGAINIGRVIMFIDSDIMVIISSCISCLRKIPNLAKTQHVISGAEIGVHATIAGLLNQVSNAKMTAMMTLMNGTIGLKITLRILATYVLLQFYKENALLLVAKMYVEKNLKSKKRFGKMAAFAEPGRTDTTY